MHYSTVENLLADRSGADTALKMCAVPYDTSAAAFYFSDSEGYDAQYARQLATRGTEEYELEFINGDCEFWRAIGAAACQSEVSEVFEQYDTWNDLDPEERLICSFLGDNLEGGDTLQARIDYAADNSLTVYQGSRADYALEYCEESGMFEGVIPALYQYFDFESFGRDLELNGEITEISYQVYLIR